MMATSDSNDLQVLLDHAELLMETGRLQEALILYDRIVGEGSSDSHYLQRRGMLRRLTGNLTGAITDYDQAIELSPDDASLYCERGACLAHRMSNTPDLDKQAKMQCLAQVIGDYQACVERDPTNASAWLALVEAHLLQHDWDAAITGYAQCRPYIKTDQYLLVRAWLGCLAMCLANELTEDEDIALLYDKRIKLHHTSWCIAEIDTLLDELARGGYDNAALGCAMEFQQQFLSHFIESPIRAET